MRKIRDMNPQEKEQYPGLMGKLMIDTVPDDASFILVIFDRETGQSQLISDSPNGITNIILENILEQRRKGKQWDRSSG